MEVIPAIDLLGGRCVRLYQGDFNQVIRYDQDPLELARSYQAAGMTRLHVVDLDGAKTGDPLNLPLITRLAGELGMAVQAGGGIRSLDRARALLDAGAERVVVGSVAAEQPEEALAWLKALGAGRLVLAFDVRTAPDADPQVQTRGWTQASGTSLWTLMTTFMEAGARHFLCTDIARDGTLAGPNVDLYREARARQPEARVIASGGVSGLADLEALRTAGAAAVVTGKALLDGRLSLEEIRQFSRAA
jgi:phosphoribosylformimino-5-aminoimidazole carboxamide ribotide isomerase